MRGKKIFLRHVGVWLLGVALLAWVSPAAAQVRMSEGQTVYVPAYSHVYYGDQGRTLNLTVTLNIRNTDSSKTITVDSVKYLNSKGKLVHEYVTKPIQLDPLSSTYFLVKESDVAGGAGASFLVNWQAKEQVNAPLIETIMIGATANQGISLTSPGQVVAEKKK
jgi:hypothetical protein